jgi:hypothetical protein
MEIVVPDSVLSNLSVSVTDASLYSDTAQNIFSDLLLSGDLRGYIHRPAYYFQSNDEDVNAKLDLVMMTHGWRRIKWDELIKGRLPELKYPADSDYLQIKGRVSANGQTTIKAGINLSLVLQARDSSKQYFSVPVAPNGTFRQRGLIFFDSSRVYYQINGDKRLADAALVNFQYGLPLFPYAQAVRVPQWLQRDSSAYINSRLFYAGVDRTKKSFDSAVVLKEVVVQSKIKSPVDILDDKYTTGLFSDKTNFAFDIVNDDRAQGSLDLFHYLQMMIPGMAISNTFLGANGAEDANSSNAPGINWRDGTPDIFINEIQADALRANELQMSDIAYVKVFRPPFMASAGSGASGAIAIYTKKGADLKTSVRGLNNALLTGYTAYKEFYHPDYIANPSKTSDLRTTLYWNPYVLTDKHNKVAKISFFNNDITTRFRVIVEGVNADGKLARVEKIVE